MRAALGQHRSRRRMRGAARWPALLLACCVALVACAWTAGPEQPFALLYSTSGYEAAGTKRALVRALGSSTGPDDLDGARWRLLAAGGGVVAEGALRPRGVTFGAPLWEIDFSEAGAGEERRLEVLLPGGSGAETKGRALHSLPFPIETGLFTRRMALALSVENAALRRAPESQGGGYYDCNSQMGEAYSHAMFAAGLIEFERRRGDRVGAATRGRLRDEIHRAVDYVLALHDEQTGEIANQHASRPGGNEGDFNTQEGVYGLVQYLALGPEADPRRSAEIARRARTSLGYLASRDALYPELGAAVWARLYAHSGEAPDLEQGVRYAEVLASSFEPQTRFRHPLRGVPWFEGLVLLSPAVEPAHRDRWREQARGWAQALLGAAARNGYGVVPALGEAEWNDMAGAPVSQVDEAFYANAHFLTTSVDALLLAEWLPEAGLERVAASGLQWVTGVNPGFPAEVVTQPEAGPAEPTWIAASFVTNGPGRHVRPWERWWWEGIRSDSPAQTTVNGFVAPPGRGLVYDTREWQPAETFIRTDGLLLRAAPHYEDYLERRE